MKNRFLFATVIAVITTISGASAFAQNIAAAEAESSGTTGVAIGSDPIITAILAQPGGTYNGNTYTHWAFMAEDSSGSIDIYTTSNFVASTGFTPAVGDAISLTGEYYYYDTSLPEMETLTAFSVVSSGNAVPAPEVVTISEINQATLPFSTEGYYLQLNNVTISGAPTTWPSNGNETYSVTDGVNSMELYYWPSSYSTDGAIAGDTVPTGPVDMDGFVTIYSGTAQFTPTLINPVPEPATLGLCGAGGLLALALRRRKS